MRKIIIITVSLVLLVVAAVIAVNRVNKVYPKRYIADHYPNAEVLGFTSQGDAVINASKVVYQCYDNEHDFAFTQEFLKKNFLGMLMPATDTYRSYDHMMQCQSSFGTCREKLESEYEGEFLMFPNPDNLSGIQVLLPKSAAGDMSNVEKLLDSAVKEVRDTSYISYSLYVCSDEIYRSAASADISKLTKLPEFMNGDVAQLGPEFLEKLLDISLSETSANDADVSFIKGEPNSTGEKKITYYKQ